MDTFLCYRTADLEDIALARFVHTVYFHLTKHCFNPYLYPCDPARVGPDGRTALWTDSVAGRLSKSDYLVIFTTGELSRGQFAEIAEWINEPGGRVHAIHVDLGPAPGMDSSWSILLRRNDHVTFHGTIRGFPHTEKGAALCAKQIVTAADVVWFDDGLPIGYPFAYEKQIVAAYINPDTDREEALRLSAQGCPWQWPALVPSRGVVTEDNLISEDESGNVKSPDEQIVVDTRTARRDQVAALTLLEAGPRKQLHYTLGPGNRLTVGILVSGGIAPGINAVIEGIVARHELYRERSSNRYRLKINGYKRGFEGLEQAVDGADLNPKAVAGWAELGGSKLGTSRADHLLPQREPAAAAERVKALNKVIAKLRADNVNILYIIGGDGSMRAAHAIHKRTQDMAVVGIPKTMDNDILWVWQSFGFMSAVEKAREAVLNLHTEVESNPRLGIIQLFGSDSGFVASHAAYSAVCDLVLIPEEPWSIDEICARMEALLARRWQESQLPYGLIVMAETALPLDARDHIDSEVVHLSDQEKEAVDEFLKNGGRVLGQTPDVLRSAGLKMVSRLLKERINARLGAAFGRNWDDVRVVTNEPRHLIRSIRPSVSDVIFAERLGALAVDNAMAGYTDFMVSQWLTEFALVPLPLVVLGRKRVYTKGMFWKSVRAKTGQFPRPAVDVHAAAQGGRL
jgi:6-phosphofructokinase 1